MEKTQTLEEQIMTAREVAAYLRLADATVYKLARSGEIPAAKVGRSWRFKRSLIDDWLQEQSEDGSNREPDKTSD
jgi:excisionase family DNA binding protein